MDFCVGLLYRECFCGTTTTLYIYKKLCRKNLCYFPLYVCTQYIQTNNYHVECVVNSNKYNCNAPFYCYGNRALLGARYLHIRVYQISGILSHTCVSEFVCFGDGLWLHLFMLCEECCSLTTDI